MDQHPPGKRRTPLDLLPSAGAVPAYVLSILLFLSLLLTYVDSIGAAASAGARMSEELVLKLGWYSPLLVIPVVLIAAWVSRQPRDERKRWGYFLNSLVATIAALVLAFVIGFNVRPTRRLTGEGQSRVANALYDARGADIQIRWTTNDEETELHAREIGRAVEKLRQRERASCADPNSPECKVTHLDGPSDFAEHSGTGVNIQYGEARGTAYALLESLCAEKGIHARQVPSIGPKSVLVWVSPIPERP